MDYEVRLMKEGDVDRIRELMNKIFTYNYGYGYNPKYHRDYDNLVEVYIKNSNNFLYVVEDKRLKKIVGIGGVIKEGIKSKYVPENIKKRYIGEDVGKIVRVFVDSLYRGKGIGSMIVERIRKKVREDKRYKKLILSTEKSSKFWESMGGIKIYDEKPLGYEVYYEIKF
jgi:GNAT superfamily N-acetyltransferase